jgi:hydroxyacylglutathione hydrolase
MLNIESFSLGPLATNAYLITDTERRKGVVIDPGMHPDQLIKAIKYIDIEAILLTHAHFDHIGGVDEIRKLKSCPVYLHRMESEWLTNPELNGSLRWPDMGGAISSDPAEFELREGEDLSFFGQSFQVLHTPGHSPGSVSFVLKEEGVVISGDVLFRTSVGRTDLPGGSSQKLYGSIHKKLFKLDPGTKVFPGHGPSTSIGFEIANNPYV